MGMLSEIVISNLDPPEPDEEEKAEGEEEFDCDEMVIANSCDMIISFAWALGSNYEKYYLSDTHKILLARLGKEYSHRDKVLVIGAFANIFQMMPNVAKKNVDGFLKKLDACLAEELEDDIIWNSAFAIGTLA